MPRLRRSDPSVPGYARRRQGRGFRYLDAAGRGIADPEALARIRGLAIPPAWTDVWICPDPFGHLQALGTDAAGRRQYLYHPSWRARRDQQKFDRMLEFARALPGLRATTAAHLSEDGLTRNRVLACATRLLDRGFFRIGSEAYAGSNGTYGLATMHRRHVTVGRDGLVEFDYVSKGAKRRVQSVVDPEVHEVVAELMRRRGDPQLLAWRSGRRWVDVRSDDINAYIKDVAGDEYSAKDFRTWHGTVMAAMALAVAAPASRSRTAAKRAMSWAVRDVAEYLGNTPAVCRASYIDPRVFDRYRSGWTIAGVLGELGSDRLDGPELQGLIEEAVVDLIRGDDSSSALERAA
jgi:DNA topoisomerase I